MRLFIASLLIVVAFSSCKNDEALYSSIIKMQDCARAQFENEIGYLSANASRNNDENPKKFSYAFEKIEEPLEEYLKIIEDDSYCTSNSNRFLSDLKINIEKSFKEIELADSLWIFSISDSPSALELSSIRLAITACYQDYCSIYNYGYLGCSLRFYHIQPYSIATTEQEYHFSLIAEHLTKYKLKSFQVDSVKKNDRIIFAESRIQPSSIAAVSIEHSGIGSYEVYGHVDVFEPRYHFSDTFTHKFSISD